MFSTNNDGIQLLPFKHDEERGSEFYFDETSVPFTAAHYENVVIVQLNFSMLQKMKTLNLLSNLLARI